MSNTSLFGNRYYFTPKFTKLAVLLIIAFCALGIWQVKFSMQSRDLIEAYNTRINQPTIQPSNLISGDDWRFYTIQFQGSYDNEHQILLANRNYKGQAGYEVVTPVKSPDSATGLLVDRGWIPLSKNPTDLPSIDSVNDQLSFSGTLIKPYGRFFWMSSFDQNNLQWPLVVRFIDTEALSRVVGYPLLPYVVLLGPNNPYGFVRQWQPVASLKPERNMAYAKQWFSLAVVVLLLYVIFNINRRQE